MDFRIILILWSEEFDKLGLGGDVACVLLAELLRLREESVLDIIQQSNDARYEGIFAHVLLILGRAVAARNHDAIARDITWSDFNTNRDALFDPVPSLLTAAHVAVVELHLHWCTHIALTFQRLLQLVAIIEHFGAGFLLRSKRNDHQVRGRDTRRQYQTIVV